MNALPTLRQLQFFIALCDTGNYHRAADKLGITQPALSAAIKEIEGLLGGAMIDRSVRKKVIPTAAGEKLLREARLILNHCTQACDQVRREIDPHFWTIRLGVIPSIAPFVMPQILPVIKERLPKLDIRIIEATSAHLKQRMADGVIDYALMAFPYDMPGFVQHELFQEAFVCAVPAQNDPFAGHGQITMADLRDQKLLLLEDGHCLRSHALEACRISAAQEQETFRASSLSTLIQMVAHGQGMTLLPRMAVTYGALPPDIAIKPFAAPAPVRTIGAAWREKSPREQDFQAFTRSVIEALQSLGFLCPTRKLKSA